MTRSTMSREEPLRVAVAGLGVHGLRYARALRAGVPGARLAAVCRRDAAAGRALAAELGAPWFASAAEMAASGAADAVAIVTPPESHAEIALGAIASGMHVLVEKPMAFRAEDCREMVRAAREAGVVLAVAHTLRFEAALLALRARIAERGPPLTLALVHRLEPRRLVGRAPAAYDACLYDTAIHALDAARWLAGDEVAEAQASAEHPAPLGRELVLATLRMTGGCVATVEASALSTARASRAEAVWADLQLSADLVSGTLWERRGRETRELPVPPAPRPIDAVLSDFVRAARAGRAPAVSGEDGLRAVELAEACARSGREGRPVRLA